MTFAKGDIVQVCYSSPRMIEEWMAGQRPVGPGDVGVVKYEPTLGVGHRSWPGQQKTLEQEGWHNYVVSVTFPMIGTYGIHARDLRLLQKAETNT